MLLLRSTTSIAAMSSRPFLGRDVKGPSNAAFTTHRVDRSVDVIDDMDTDFGYWLAGLIDGEGCFVIAHRQQGGSDYYSPTFSLKMRDDDGEILRLIHQTTGLGRLYHLTRQPGNPQITWDVIRKQDMLALVGILDEYPLRTRKRKDYLVWKEAVFTYADGSGRSSALADLKLSMETARKYAGTRA